MKTTIIILTLAFVVSSNMANAQKRNLVNYLDQLPKGLELDVSERSYTMTTDYFDYDLKGNFLRKKRLTGDITAEFDGDSVRWNDVYISQVNDLKTPFPKGMKQDYMENFTYKQTDDVLKDEFFEKIPEANMLVKNLIWDKLGFDIFAYCCWDSLMLNKAHHAKELNSEVDLSGEGTFENKDIVLTWIGITEMNNEICAIIKYSVMNNPLQLDFDNVTVSGRSHYWGEIYVSLSDKQIEYVTLLEDVITNVRIEGQAENILGYTVRNITLSRIK